MIVRIFNERVHVCQDLPDKISGMYPIYIGGEIVVNIIADGENWVVQLSSMFTSKDLYYERPRLEPYKIYVVDSKITGEHFFIIATPKYNPNYKSYNIPVRITIGSSPDCDLYYPLEFSKTEYLQIDQNDHGWTAYTNSPHFFISGERLQTGQAIHSGDYVYFFGLKLIFIQSRIILDNPNNQAIIKEDTLELTTPDDLRPKLEESVGLTIKGDLPLYTEKDYFYKTPRFNYIVEAADVVIDMPPDKEKPSEVPAILTIGPQLTMATASTLSMSVLIISATTGTTTRSTIWFSVAAMAITLLGIILWPALIRKFNKKRIKHKEEKRQKKYSSYLIQKNNLLNFIKANQYESLIENNPTPATCAQIIQNRNGSLWQRSFNHEDFLNVRLGVGKIETKLNINKPKEAFSIDEDDNLLLSAKKVINDALYIENAPFAYNLTLQSISAIIGDVDSLKRFMDCLFLQIITFHSYTDLKIVVFTSEPRKWEYLKTLPHCWNSDRTMRYYATSLEKFSTIAAELEKTFSARTTNDEEVRLEDNGDAHHAETTFKDFSPYYLLFIDNMATVRNVPLIKKILHYKRNIGFSILTVATNISNLPNETSSFICVSPQKSIVITDDNQKSFIADFNDAIQLSFCTQQLANIPVPAEKGKYELPSSISLLELYGLGRIEQFNSLSRWSHNNPSVSLSVPIGIDQNNETFQMDIHEKAFGPHGLIAGTTGSGKSEWIITYILSLAINFSPDEVQFVLIDYKGGGLAKSFENADLGIKLPHLAGTITNLDKSEIFRSISAIESELKRRQSIFNDTREKLREGSMDIYKYQQAYRRGLVNEPLSHLLIICDEFAELKQQEPDFMAQLISTARVGRSLGVHLILATQKPSGVVNDQIWSNSKFKVCLKVQSKSDSNEIIRRPDAAFLKQTGAFYIQVGNDDYFNLGQSAWAGAKYYPSDTVSHKIDDSVQCIDDIGQVIESSTEIKQQTQKKDQGEELINIVSYISKISKQTNLICRQMWLKNIEPKMLLSDLKKRYNLNPDNGYNYNTIIGEYDEPRLQQQAPLELDLAAGNIAIVGRADGSIEKLISTIIWSSICSHTPKEIAYYILDFGTETMKKFAKFPQVGEVVFQDELDRVAGVISLISDEIERRKEILSDYNGSFEYYNQVENNKMHLIVVIINSYDVFGETLPRAIGLITELFRDAPKYGITFIVSSNATNVISQRLLQYFNHYILMQLSDDAAYRNLTGCRRGLIPKKVIGRGICKVKTDDVNSYCEFQTAMIAPEKDEPKVLKQYADKCVEYYKTKVKQLTKVPDDTTSDDLVKYITNLANVPIGSNLYEKNIAKYDFLGSKLHLITGPSIADNMNFVYGLASILSKVPNVKVRIVDLLGIFKKPILDIKIFEEDVNLVFGALEKDVLTRTDAQDFGITLVIGAGQYKEKLSKGGIEIYKNLFANLYKSNKCIYILIDNYEYLRNLKLEDWFKTIDVTRGIWLGQGLNNQSLFDCQKVSNEDEKLHYPGLAFNIEDKKYHVIKTLMDNDI